MADINSRSRLRATAARGGPPAVEARLTETQMARAIELMFFAYRDFTGDPDAILAERGFGRAHHRVLHFVSRYPGLRVADLLEILKITKQSLARVLRQLIEGGLIEQHSGAIDRRERLLYTTDAGRGLARELMKPQLRRIGEALGGLTPEGREAVERFLTAMIEDGERESVGRLVGPRSRDGEEP